MLEPVPTLKAAALLLLRGFAFATTNSLLLVGISANLVMDGVSEWQIRRASRPERAFYLAFCFVVGIVGLSRPPTTTAFLKRVTGVNSFLSITSRRRFLSLDDCVFGE